MLHSAGCTAAICGCAKPVCLSDCLCGSLSPRGVTVCEYVRGGDYYRVCRSLSVPKRLTHGTPHLHTHTHTHSRSPTHNPTYQRLRSTICTRDTVSYDGRAYSLTRSHAYFLSSTVALSGPHQYYMLFFWCVCVCCVCVCVCVRVCVCAAGMTGILGLVPTGEWLNIYIWSVRTEPSLSLISLITHTKVPTTHTHTPACLSRRIASHAYEL